MVNSFHEWALTVADTISIPSLENVQILLTLCLVDELSLRPGIASPVQVARCWLSAAIRHARDLGLDRACDGREARVWSCARVLDIWQGARTGAPPIMSVRSLPTPPKADDTLAHLIYLSLLLGRLMALVYGPEGMAKTTHADLTGLRDALTTWKSNLPPTLRSGTRCTHQAGLLHLLYTSTIFLLYRPVMRWSFIVPSHIELNTDVPVWLSLLSLSREAIDFAAGVEDAADLLFFGPYALGLAGLVQYHTWARRGEWEGAEMVGKAKAAAQRWVAAMEEGEMPLLRRVSCLYRLSLTNAATGLARLVTQNNPISNPAQDL